MSLDSHSQMETIVLQGSRVQQGMPDFENTINKDELESIRAFVVTQARQLQQFQERQ